MAKKILVLRFSSIGDIVLTTPVLRGLKQQLGAEVHFLTKKAFAAVVEPNLYLDKVYVFEKEFTEVLGQLKAEQYDHVVDLHHNLRSWRVRQALGVPATTFPKLNIEKWLLVNTGVNFLPEQHIVDRYLIPVQIFGVKYDGQGLDYFIPEGQDVEISTLGANFKAEQFVCLVTGATHATKRMPEEQLTELARRLAPLPVVLLGGKAEMDAGEAIAANAGNHVVNCCGRLSLHQSASVVRQASVVITHDTGLMHIAAAFRRQIISIWGSTVPAFGMYPFLPEGAGANIIMETTGLRCRPCSKIGHNRCPKGHFKCIGEISVEKIERTVKELFR